jgi:tetratricopeptide (TPR) repeat protein
MRHCVRSNAWEFRRVRTTAALTILLLAAGCATGDGPGGGKRYGLEDVEAYDAVARGEGRQALAYYEARASELERGGALSKAEAAKAYTAAAIVSQFLGAYQKGIRHGLRALEILEGFPEYEAVFQGKAIVRSFLGFTYLQAGDLEEARRQFERSLELTKRSTNYMYALAVSSAVWTGLALVTYQQGDYPKAIEHGKEGIRLGEEYFSRLDLNRQWIPRYNELRERNLRVIAMGLTMVGRAEWELKKPDDAEASLRRAVEVAREVGAQEFEVLARAALASVTYS